MPSRAGLALLAALAALAVSSGLQETELEAGQASVPNPFSVLLIHTSRDDTVMFALELVQAVRDVHVECEVLRDEEEKKYALQVREMTSRYQDTESELAKPEFNDVDGLREIVEENFASILRSFHLERARVLEQLRIDCDARVARITTEKMEEAIAFARALFVTDPARYTRFMISVGVFTHELSRVFDDCLVAYGELEVHPSEIELFSADSMCYGGEVRLLLEFIREFHFKIRVITSEITREEIGSSELPSDVVNFVVDPAAQDREYDPEEDEEANQDPDIFMIGTLNDDEEEQSSNRLPPLSATNVPSTSPPGPVTSTTQTLPPVRATNVPSTSPPVTSTTQTLPPVRATTDRDATSATRAGDFTTITIPARTTTDVAAEMSSSPPSSDATPGKVTLPTRAYPTMTDGDVATTRPASASTAVTDRTTQDSTTAGEEQSNTLPDTPPYPDWVDEAYNNVINAGQPEEEEEEEKEEEEEPTSRDSFHSDGTEPEPDLSEQPSPEQNRPGPDHQRPDGNQEDNRPENSRSGNSQSRGYRPGGSRPGHHPSESSEHDESPPPHRPPPEGGAQHHHGAFIDPEDAPESLSADEGPSVHLLVYMFMSVGALLVVLCAALIVAFLVMRYKRIHGAGRPTISKDQKLAVMKQTGYVNPTYKFFDQAAVV